jgi:hypothetical protein
VKRGKDGVRESFRQLIADLPGEATRVEDGIDTFVFRDGLIRVQTVRYTLIAKS